MESKRRWKTEERMGREIKEEGRERERETCGDDKSTRQFEDLKRIQEEEKVGRDGGEVTFTRGDPQGERRRRDG